MKKIGDIQLFAEIKRGDSERSGSTYRGLETATQRVVLVKTFKTKVAGDASNGAPSRFQQEAAIYATIQHDNVVKLLRYGAEDGVRFLVLEFIEGLTLRALLLRASSSLPPWEIVVAIFLGVLEGVKEIHRRGFIHRDLKPENILIGNDGSIKICDFDLAVSERKLAGSHESLANGLTGSPGYLAPEIVLGEQATASSDIFSLGIILYEMLTGARPFEAPSATGEMNSIVKLPHVSALAMNPSVPRELDELVDQLLAKDPGKRACTVDDLLNRFQKHFHIGSVESRSEMVRRYLVDPQTAFPEISPKQPPQESRATTFPLRRVATVAMLSVILAVAGFVAYSKVQKNDDGVVQGENQDIALQDRHEIAETSSFEPPIERAKIPEAISSKNEQQPNPENDETATREFAPEARTYTVMINSNPWAFLFIDDDSIGQTPLSTSVILKSGSHQLLFKNPKLPLIYATANIDESVAGTLNFSLWNHVAQLEIQITPWAEMFIDGERRELPPGEKTMILLPGKYSFRFVHPQLGEKHETLFLHAGETRRLTMNMF